MIDITSIFSSFGDYSLYLILIFIIVLIVAIKITKLLFGLGIAAVIGGLFPLIINDFLKIDGLIDPGIESSITFAVLAVIIYGLYSISSILYNLLKTTGQITFFPIRVLAFLGETVIKILSIIGSLVIIPFKYLRKFLFGEKNKEKTKETDDEDDDFWKGKNEANLDESEEDNSEDIFVEKSEEKVREPIKVELKKDKNSFFDKVYADYNEFENKKKKKD